ncbi:MAG: glutathione S-transferase family protein [Woeseiaceae bacterium]
MELIGMLDSPFVRRAAISARMLGFDFVHRSLSVFRNYEDIRALNPLVKAPTLILDDGRVLVDSTLIIDHLETTGRSGRSLMPRDPQRRAEALELVGIALVAMEKAVALFYEMNKRPPQLQFPAWIERLDQQLKSALELLERRAAGRSGWLTGGDFTQADLSAAVGWRFIRHSRPQAAPEKDYPALLRLWDRAEGLPEFRACPFE